MNGADGILYWDNVLAMDYNKIDPIVMLLWEPNDAWKRYTGGNVVHGYGDATHVMFVRAFEFGSGRFTLKNEQYCSVYCNVEKSVLEGLNLVGLVTDGNLEVVSGETKKLSQKVYLTPVEQCRLPLGDGVSLLMRANRESGTTIVS